MITISHISLLFGAVFGYSVDPGIALFTLRITKTMDPEIELFEAVEEVLKEKGVLNQLTCQVRAEILQVLKSSFVTDQKKTATATEAEKLPTNASNFIVNELIKEYLDYNGYDNTANVLAIESNLPKKRITRVELETTLKVHSGPNAKKVPLIYSIVSDLRK